MTPTSKPKTKLAKKLLVVEDEGQIGLVLNMILSERNFDLDYVSSLLSAQEYLEKNKPSLVILDNKLPDGFGVDFISYIKKKYPSIKIIMISGLVQHATWLWKMEPICFLKSLFQWTMSMKPSIAF